MNIVRWSRGMACWLTVLALVVVGVSALSRAEISVMVKDRPSHVMRNGLNNARIRFERDKVGRVVFLGGSITASPGWRDMVCASLKKRFTDTRFDFINAGIPSLGSTPGAFRYERDVMNHGPVDLLLCDAAVNDQVNGFTPTEQVCGMEGIVRKARLLNPNIDIVILHFVEDSMIDSYKAGKTPPVIASHERVAEHYGLPSLDMPREMTRGIAAGEYTLAQWGGVHPSPFGHELYAKGIDAIFNAAWSAPLQADGRVTPNSLPAKPLDEASYFRAKMVDVKEAKLGPGWRIDPAWRPTDKLEKRSGFVDVPTLIAEEAGATLTFVFEGRAVGIFVASGPDAGVAEYSIDGSEFRTRDLFTGWSRALHLPWAVMLDGDLKPGQHVLTLRPAAKSNPNSAGHAIRVVHLLVN